MCIWYAVAVVHDICVHVVFRCYLPSVCGNCCVKCDVCAADAFNGTGSFVESVIGTLDQRYVAEGHGSCWVVFFNGSDRATRAKKLSRVNVEGFFSFQFGVENRHLEG